jgi:hypothetical protein
MRNPCNISLRHILLFAFGFLFTEGNSQDNLQPSAAECSYSFMTGGMIIDKSTLWINKISMERKHIGLLIDITRDTYKETWDDQSTGKYKLWSLSAAGRYYLKPYGRSLFAEISLGLAVPDLTVNDVHGKEQIVRNLGLTAWGLGWRFGKNRSRLFGEIGFRSALPLKTLHLFTGAGPLPGSTGKSITYHSWYFEKLKGTSQLYIGAGYSLWKK